MVNPSATGLAALKEAVPTGLMNWRISCNNIESIRIFFILVNKVDY